MLGNQILNQMIMDLINSSICLILWLFRVQKLLITHASFYACFVFLRYMIHWYHSTYVSQSLLLSSILHIANLQVYAGNAVWDTYSSWNIAYLLPPWYISLPCFSTLSYSCTLSTGKVIMSSHLIDSDIHIEVLLSFDTRCIEHWVNN